MQYCEKNIELGLASLAKEKLKLEFEMISIQMCDKTPFPKALTRFLAFPAESAVMGSRRNRTTPGFSKFETPLGKLIRGTAIDKRFKTY